jgi:hypothetical protein
MIVENMGDLLWGFERREKVGEKKEEQVGRGELFEGWRIGAGSVCALS